MRGIKKAVCFLICGVVALTGCARRHVGGAPPPLESPGKVLASSQPQEERLPVRGEVADEFAYVTEGVDLGLPQGLAFLHPSADAATTAGSYYLTGRSNPEQPLLLNGEPVENRGAMGSFACFVPLEPGDNLFTLEQGEKQVSVTIRRGSAESGVVTTDRISQMEPMGDLGVPGGDPFLLKCVAPAGSAVTADIHGETVTLRQNTPAQEGVPATFSAEYLIPSVEGTLDLGPVTYFLEGTAYPSEGKLYAIRQGEQMKVEIRNVSSSVFSGPSISSAVLTTGKKGAVDAVTDFGGDSASGEMYQLRMGGWIQAAAATPLSGDAEIDNRVSKTAFSIEDGRETVTFNGTARPLYLAAQEGESITFRFYHTAGIEETPLKDSKLFSGMTAAQEGDDCLVTFHMERPDKLWGYLVDYEGGDTRLTFRPRPEPGPGDLPLEGITVAIDAGHGGTDTGTLGLPYESSPMEKDVAIATAEALRKELGLLGAKAVLVRTGDENPTMNERMERAKACWADFYISLHANSAGFSPALLDASGLEVYYFEENHQSLAESLAENVSAATGRKNRGAKRDNYRVTMQSFAPSVLVELGFMPNPGDFDSMCDPKAIYDAVTAISHTLTAYLTPDAQGGPAEN